ASTARGSTSATRTSSSRRTTATASGRGCRRAASTRSTCRRTGTKLARTGRRRRPIVVGVAPRAALSDSLRRLRRSRRALLRRLQARGPGGRPAVVRPLRRTDRLADGQVLRVRGAEARLRLGPRGRLLRGLRPPGGTGLEGARPPPARAGCRRARGRARAAARGGRHLLYPPRRRPQPQAWPPPCARPRRRARPPVGAPGRRPARPHAARRPADVALPP